MIASTCLTRQGEPEKKGKRWSYPPGPNSIGFETFIGKELGRLVFLGHLSHRSPNFSRPTTIPFSSNLTTSRRNRLNVPEERLRSCVVEMSLDQSSIPGLGKGRLEALTDGIFATVMTVLVLSLSVPVIASDVTGSKLSSDVFTDIEALWPNILGYVLSFL